MAGRMSALDHIAPRNFADWIDEQVIAIDGGWTSTLSEGAMKTGRTMVKRRVRYSGKLISV